MKKEDINMLKKLSSIPFNGTAEQEAKLNAVIAAHKHDKSQLMAVMQEAQEIYGYLPFEVQNMIAEGMDIPLEKVYGVATFYAQFALSPKGKYFSMKSLATSALSHLVSSPLILICAVLAKSSRVSPFLFVARVRTIRIICSGLENTDWNKRVNSLLSFEFLAKNSSSMFCARLFSRWK